MYRTLGLYSDEVLTSFTSASTRLVEEICANASTLVESPTRIMILVALLQNPLLGEQRFMALNMGKFCKGLEKFGARAKEALVKCWSKVSPEILGGRVLKVLQSFITIELTHCNRIDDRVAGAIKLMAVVEEANASEDR